MLTNTFDEAYRIWLALQTIEVGSKEYTQNVKDLESMISIQEKLLARAEPPVWKQILTSPAFIGGVFQLTATMVVVNHEQVGIIVSKASNWIRFK